jgi:tRNA A-37 threonylcarbamoyl transferase component Bud32
MTATIHCAGCQHAYIETALFCPNCGRPKVRETPSDPLLGKLLGERFLVQELLGQGGSGTIYRAEHVTLRRKVAIKVLHTELSRDDLAVERFRREATTVAEIDNEHIVEIHDFGRTPDARLYLAMELLEGETLDGVLARERQLSVERAADVLIQVGEALMEAHAIGYVHRDLRPRNIYLAVRRGKANFIKLLDFGLAKLVETEGQAASTNLGMTFGDPRYMSPEQARGDRIDRRADIYQLGCVAYEMLTGAPPFLGTKVFDILTKQVTEAPQPLPSRRPGVPLWMEAAVARMLAKDPENRFATTTRMVEALRRGLETGEVMDDEVARRRESIPPPSVSRVMQRMGIQAAGDAWPAEPAPAAPPARSHAPGHAPAGAAAQPARAPAGPDPAATLKAPVAPPPKPDSVELLRKRTGTPHLGLPALDTAAVQPPVAGVIEPGPALPIAPVAGSPAAAARARAVDPLPASHTDSATPRGKRSSTGPIPATGDLNISQVWYEEGDQLSSDEDLPAARRDRARKTISPSTTDLTGYDEPPRRRWGLVAGIAGLLTIGGAVAFAVTRGGSTSAPSPHVVAAPAPAPAVAAAPSQILPADRSPDPVTPAAPVAVARPAAPPRSTEPRRVATGRDPDRRRPEGFPVLGSEPTRRLPGAGIGTRAPAPIPAADPVKLPTPPSITDTPKDPYTAEDPPADGVAADKKAEFFANLGAQQLIGGDTTGAASSFKKAVELDPKNASATIGMGEIALRQGLFGDAIAHLSKAAKLVPRSSKVFTLLGEAYLNSGNHTQAAAQFKKALQLDPDNSRARDGYNEASSRVPPPTDEPASGW